VRVAFFLDQFPESVGGTERQFLLLARELLERDVQCAVYTLRGFTNLAESLPRALCRNLEVRKMASLSAFGRLRSVLREERRRGTRVVQTFLNDVSFLVPPLARTVGLRTVVSRRDLGFWYTPANLRVLRLVSRFVDAYAVNSEAVATVVRESETTRVPIKVIPNAIALQSSSHERAQARQTLGLGADDFVIVCVANLKPLKRQETAIAALACLQTGVAAGATTGVAAGGSPARLVLVGADNPGATSPSYRSELEALARSLGVSAAVTMTGGMRDPGLAWACADVGVLLSDSEGLSNAALEGLMAQVPMICTAVGGNLDIIEEGVNGFLVPCQDPVAVATAIDSLRSDPVRRARMGSAARESVLRRYHVDAMVAAYVQLYRELESAA
jgi:glycosyltransferase involved in cell wall biosynthesis